MSSSLSLRVLKTTCVFVRRKPFLCVAHAKFSVSARNFTAEECHNTVIPASQPGMMQAAVLNKFSEPLSIENFQPPQSIEPSEVIVDVHYCALNGSDVLAMNNSLVKLPKILGYEFVGKLSKVGDDAAKRGFKVGQKVVVLNKTGQGGLAEQCIADVADIWKIPSTLKSLDTVCLLENYLTAYIGLQNTANLEEDEMVLVNVGLGGIGLAAVDLATNVYRAQVIGVSKSEDRATLVRDKGAFASLKYKDKKLVKKIEEFAAERDIKDVFGGAEGEKFKQMLDSFTSIYKEENQQNLLRADNFTVLVEHLSREGRLIIAGFALTKLDKENGSHSFPFSMSGINLQEFKEKNLELYREAGTDILQYHEDGLIKPSYSLITGLYKVNDAVKYIKDFKSTEKVVIDIKNPTAETVCKD